MIDEGYIKYNSHRVDGDIPDVPWFRDLNMVRTTLWNMKLIGIYDNGIGYGNISHRYKDNSFVISGSKTGGSMVLSKEQYALVTSFDLENNSVEVIGKIDASSESMSHGAMYKAMDSVNVVIHVHNKKIFDKMLELGYVATPKDVPFGTPQLAKEIERVVTKIGESSGIFVTAGHDEGIIAYGANFDDAYTHIETVYSLR